MIRGIEVQELITSRSATQSLAPEGALKRVQAPGSDCLLPIHALSKSSRAQFVAQVAPTKEKPPISGGCKTLGAID